MRYISTKDHGTQQWFKLLNTYRIAKILKVFDNKYDAMVNLIVVISESIKKVDFKTFYVDPCNLCCFTMDCSVPCYEKRLYVRRKNGLNMT